jgi:hypothetical protein
MTAVLEWPTSWENRVRSRGGGPRGWVSPHDQVSRQRNVGTAGARALKLSEAPEDGVRREVYE